MVLYEDRLQSFVEMGRCGRHRVQCMKRNIWSVQRSVWKCYITKEDENKHKFNLCMPSQKCKIRYLSLEYLFKYNKTGKHLLAVLTLSLILLE
jgi:hypothetical protein